MMKKKLLKTELINRLVKSKPLFASHNEPLLISLLEHLAIPTETVDVVRELTPFINLLWAQDTNPLHNQLGPLLGTLIRIARERKATYCVKQLFSWLQRLQPNDKSYYPIDILSSLLTGIMSSPKNSLGNSNLQCLDQQYSISKEQSACIDIVLKTFISNTEFLPEENKAQLINYVLEGRSCSFIQAASASIANLYRQKYSSQWINAVMTKLIPALLNDIDPQQQLQKLEYYTQGFKNDNNAVLKKLWEIAQIKVINWSERLEVLNKPQTDASQYKKLIAVCISRTPDEYLKASKSIEQLLQAFSDIELERLAEYMATEPRPTLSNINMCIQHQCSDAESLIHYFEATIQGHNKRDYSTTMEDRKQLLRILDGLRDKEAGGLDPKRKDTILSLLYYLNTHSVAQNLAEITMLELRQQLHAAIQQSKQNNEDAVYATARALACMREILLRKTGKWANHTQMLDLLLAGSSPESLIHQVRTGEGKSIITIMRVAFLALQGNIVDVFTAKESLSERDHDEFAPVLDAMGVRHAYVTAGSPTETYIDKLDANGIGAANYATIANASLHWSRLIWQLQSAPALVKGGAAPRTLFGDEIDHILADTVALNYADNGDNTTLYNFDAWAYAVIDAFYIKNKEEFAINKQSGELEIGGADLRDLAKALEKIARIAPEESTFYADYILPATQKPGEHHPISEELIIRRDTKLMQLLKAAHSANNLKSRDDYSIRIERKLISTGPARTIGVRFAKVVIDNQIQQGATYSELVQQFLHTRLNREAVAKGEEPIFFIEPDSQIMLSFNAKHILNNFYDRIEGCTGTAGSREKLKEYREQFGIESTIKMPTHQEIRTTYHPKQYCKDEFAHIEAIYQVLKKHPDQPILVTCANDSEVVRISNALHEIIKNDNEWKLQRTVTADTNDSGKAEQEMLEPAGAMGAVTISARMGRGTDIKPKGKKGLVVLRTDALETPEVEKQERGRQGRNSMLGDCYDVLDDRKITLLYNKIKDFPRVQEIYEQQRQHLEHKLAKRKKDRTALIVTNQRSSKIFGLSLIKRVRSIPPVKNGMYCVRTHYFFIRSRVLYAIN